MEALEEVTRVGHVAAHRRVGPGGLAVAVEAQVQRDQVGDGLDRRLVEVEGLHALARHLRAHDLVVVEGHGAIGLEAAGRRLADVVHEGGEAQDEVGGRNRTIRAGLQVHRLLDDGEGVLVDVLVALVLVHSGDEAGDLGQDDVGNARVHHQLDAAARVGRNDESLELGADAFGGDDLQARGHGLHRVHDIHVDVEAQLRRETRGAHDAQRVVVEGLLGGHGGAQVAVREVGQAAARVDEGHLRQAHRHRVDREVTARQVTFERVAEGHLGLARADLVLVGAVGRHLDNQVAATTANRAKLLADVPGRVAPRRQELLGALGARRGRHIEVVRSHSQERVAHGSADERELLPGLVKNRAEFHNRGRERCKGPRGVRHEGRNVRRSGVLRGHGAVIRGS